MKKKERLNTTMTVAIKPELNECQLRPSISVPDVELIPLFGSYSNVVSG